MRMYDIFKKQFSKVIKCLLITYICKHRKLVIITLSQKSSHGTATAKLLGRLNIQMYIKQTIV